VRARSRAQIRPSAPLTNCGICTYWRRATGTASISGCAGPFSALLSSTATCTLRERYRGLPAPFQGVAVAQ